MDSFQAILEFFLHLDKHLHELVTNYGAWTYAILFAIVFCETGLVVTPFLPGDSLLFAVGTLAAKGSLNLSLVLALLTVAAILGDTVNYHLGRLTSRRFLERGLRPRWLKQKHLDRTHAFFETYGAKTIVIARFVPIVRTFAPFVAGIGVMSYGKFLAYNVIGAIIWVVLLTLAGYFFGRIPWVERNFSVTILAIIVISLLPAVVEWWRARRAMRRLAAKEPREATIPSAEEAGR
jgi:membrane-associated protein